MTNTLYRLNKLLHESENDEHIELIQNWQTDIREATKFLRLSNRPKRNILAWIASITGLFNNLRINQVNKKLNMVKQADTMLNSETSQILHHIEVNDANIKNLDQVLRTKEQDMWKLDLLLRKEEVLRDAERAMNAMRRLIETLPLHKLHPDSIYLFKLVEEWEKLRTKVQASGKELAMPSWHYLLHTHISYWADHNLVIIAIEVPIKDKKNTRYDLFQIQDTPILINDKLYLANTRHKFLAVHAITKATLALSQEDLTNHATRILGTWYYHGPIIENHGEQQNCVEALWNTETEQINHWCHLTATPNREFAQPLNATAALWITNQPVQITIQCTNKPTVVMHFDHTQIINIEQNCKASSARLTFIPTPGYDRTLKIKLKEILTTKKQTPLWGNHSWHLQQPTEIKDNFNSIRDLLHTKVQLIPIWISIALASLAVISVITFIAWLYWKSRNWPQQTTKQNEPEEVKQSVSITGQA